MDPEPFISKSTEPKPCFHGWQHQNKSSLSTLLGETRCFSWVETSKWQFSQNAEQPAKKKKKNFFLNKFWGTSMEGPIFLTPNTSSDPSIFRRAYRIEIACAARKRQSPCSNLVNVLLFNSHSNLTAQWWVVNSTACVHFLGLTLKRVWFKAEHFIFQYSRLHSPKPKKQMIFENR